jgi:hypothetical protein
MNVINVFVWEKKKQTQHAIVYSFVDDVLILGSNTDIIKITR